MSLEIRDVPRRPDLRALIGAGVVIFAMGCTVALTVQSLASAGGETRDEAWGRLVRRVFYRLETENRMHIPLEQIHDTLLVSLLARFPVAYHTDGCDARIRVAWVDAAGEPKQVRVWTRRFRPRPFIGSRHVPDIFLHPEGGVLSGLRNLVLSVDDAPEGCVGIEVVLSELTPVGFTRPDAEIELCARFYTAEALPPFAEITALDLVRKRTVRFRERTSVPIELVPTRLQARVASHRWMTLGAQPIDGEIGQIQLFKQVLSVAQRRLLLQRLAMAPATPAPGHVVASGLPLAFHLRDAGTYRLEVSEPELGWTEDPVLRVERWNVGQSPSSGEPVTSSASPVRLELSEETTLVVRHEAGESASVTLWREGDRTAGADADAGDASLDLDVAMAERMEPIDDRLISYVCGPALGVLPVLEPPPALRFDWPVGGGPGVIRFRVRAVGTSESPALDRLPVTVTVTGVDGAHATPLEVELPPSDLERLETRDELRTCTGAREIYVRVPAGTREITLETEGVALVSTSHTLEGLAPIRTARRWGRDPGRYGRRDRTEEDPRAWHPLIPVDDARLRDIGAVVVVNLQRSPLRAPTLDPPTYAYEPALVVHHGGHRPILWPPGMAGTREPSARTRPHEPWSPSSYRPLREGESLRNRRPTLDVEAPAEVLQATPAGELRRLLVLDGNDLPGSPVLTWINEPPFPGADRRDHGHALRHAYRATPFDPLELEVQLDGYGARILELRVQPEGSNTPVVAVELQRLDGDPPPSVCLDAFTATRRSYQWSTGSAPAAIDPGSGRGYLASCQRLRFSVREDLAPGRYRIRVVPRHGTLHVTAGWWVEDPTRLEPGAFVTYAREGTTPIEVISDGDATIEARVPPGRYQRVSLDRGRVELPEEAQAVRVRNDTPEPLAASVASVMTGENGEIRESLSGAEQPTRWLPWGTLTRRDPASTRLRLLWTDADEPPPSSVSISGRRRPVVWSPATDARVVGDRDARVLVALPISLPEAFTLDGSHPGLWMRVQAQVALPDPVRVRMPVPGAADASFVERAWRPSGLWVDQVTEDPVTALVLLRTPADLRETVARHPGPGVPADETPRHFQSLPLAGISEQQTISRRVTRDRPDDLPARVWRPFSPHQAIRIWIGEPDDGARLATLRFRHEDVQLHGSRTPWVELWLDGRRHGRMSLHAPGGTLRFEECPTGWHHVSLRFPGSGSGHWWVRTIDQPREDDLQFLRVSRLEPGVRDLRVLVPPVSQPTSVAFEGFTPTPATTRRDLELHVHTWLVGLGWVPVRRERIFQFSGEVEPFESPDGALWYPGFRVRHRLEPDQGHAYRLIGAPVAGESVRGLRLSRTPLTEEARAMGGAR